MSSSVPNQHRVPTAGAVRSPARASRRRGSILILVVTLLSILFVIGIAFLATMNFEAEMVVAERATGRTQESARSAAGATDRLLRDALDGGADSTLASAVVSATSSGVVVDLPDFHSLGAPLEPYRDGNGDFRYAWYTDTEWAMTGRHFRNDPNVACGGPDPTTGSPGSYRDCDILATGTSSTTGESAISGDPEFNRYPFELFPGDYVAPVDVDGDGIRDSFQVNVRHLGFSRGQQASLSAAVNVPGQVRDDVFLGLRVVPHGGMVNLNDTHPRLLEKVFDLGMDRWPSWGDSPDPELSFFVHRPTQTVPEIPRDTQVFYPPAIDEPPLRRRGLLPPSLATASHLHGNRFAGGAASDASALLGTLDMRQLFPPNTEMDGLRFWPFQFDEESVRFEPRLTFDLRMDPLLSNRPPFTPPDEYDRRHLVTTTSHDDLLTRGAKTATYDLDGIRHVIDFQEAMQEANYRAWLSNNGSCPTGLELVPFEYADYPHSIPNGNPNNNNVCDCPGDPDCTFDPRKGKLQLSLSWLDRALSNDGDPSNDVIGVLLRNALIYDAFAMMIANVVGPYWETQQPCTFDPGVAPDCPAGTFCRFDVPPQPGTQGYCTSTAPAWDTPLLCGGGISCGDGYVCANVAPPGSAPGTPGVPTCVDSQIAAATQANGPPLSGAMRRPQALISRAAAALTANLIDYVDGVSTIPGADTDPDEEPTRIALRSFDFTNVRQHDPDDPFNPNNQPTSAGHELLDDNGNPIYVYGVERQPYITEIATFLNNTGQVSSWAVELFNPYSDTIRWDTTTGNPTDNTRFWLFVGTDPAAPTTVRIPIGTDFAASGPNIGAGFKVIFNGSDQDLTGGNGFTAGSDSLTNTTPPLTFTNADTIYLVRRVEYPTDPPNTPTWIVVDQMAVGGSASSPSLNIGRGVGQGLPQGVTGPAVFSIARIVNQSTPTDPGVHWTCTVPDEVELPLDEQSLGTYNTRPNTDLHPVEVQPANINSSATSGLLSDRFALFDPLVPPSPSAPGPHVAFQTTGSMLLLTRHANRAIGDFDAMNNVTNLAFTHQLVGETTWFESYCASPTGPCVVVPITVRERDQIDNGRMPVFDTGSTIPIPGSAGVTIQRSAHHVSPAHTPVGTPGHASTLPWGQFVFDYFTALPLSNPGPYRVGPAEIGQWWASRPRVDMNGLRVHGRIDLNAAPWLVLSGLPYAPMARLPVAFQPRIEAALNSLLPGNPNSPGWIGNHAGQGIVGYREARLFNGFDPSGDPILFGDSGDYGNGDPPSGVMGWRGWNMSASTTGAPPVVRRGTGLLTVGELANVRHPGHFPTGPAGEDFRMDRGKVTMMPGTEDYVSAVASLVALSDWVTVKSHVYTVYGAIRGAPGAIEEDPDTVNGSLSLDQDLRQRQLNAVDARAIRFQETVDRLPMLLDESVPTRIGGRTLSAYTDSVTD